MLMRLSKVMRSLLTTKENEPILNELKVLEDQWKDALRPRLVPMYFPQKISESMEKVQSLMEKESH